MFIFPGVHVRMRESERAKGRESEVVFLHKCPNKMEEKETCGAGREEGFTLRMRVPWPRLGRRRCIKTGPLSGPVLNTPSVNMHLSVYFQ